MKFKLHSNYQPRGDQPAAIEQLYRGLEAGEKHQVLLGVTGSGKTFTMAKLIEQSNRPALLLAHNKTLFSRKTPSNILSVTTISTSPKLTFPPRTFTSTRKPPSTTNSTSSA